MRVLVTGGAGYVGSFTVRGLAAAGHDVVVADNLSTGRREAVAEHDLRVVDILDTEALRRVFQGFRPDAVIHFAALKSSEASLRDITTYYRVNVTGTQNVLGLCAETGVGRFVFSSSCAVYGTPQICPVDESAPVRPESPYGESKYLCERMIASYGRATGMRYANLRYFNAAGAAADGALGENAGPSATQILPVAVRTALGLVPTLRIFGGDYPTADGTALRDYIHVEDLARAHARVVEELDSDDRNGAVNLGRGEPVSVRELVDALEKVSGRTIDVSTVPRRPGDPALSWADPALAESRFGWRAEHSFDDIVRTAWAWHTRVPASLE
ncbi:UDP-glucose 4-epimerase GalE [Streptomyces clavuligerus]|uniref:UDP-glucose 4-epimerase n=1 Tax=Streptomyces clavuligerus TaxID=1901 RepID=B5GL42_STRCL|nr:UDP-glucose 4-epimerase GalE [Streptomyces clavuligerus]ANW18063.1 UDP-glucose 4-epimerase GalE [Streptomyces clavuligerus]AXU12622.1 UDP-glucose 4-epimerase GalE [Streptomyces clavuligerus]EDY47038.1 UDP-glucose 4-epimerase [Streptomyces clavuligerus]EFG09356.1 UDP-glucose 4-epimerase [Streptomyces clavuligerus]MBY6302524.1 UDP-glucose 4-epimerase GalE [Streptomyces clavuligerus]